MVHILRDHDEEACIEDASIGSSTLIVFFKALKQFCPDYLTIHQGVQSFEGRTLYEIVLSAPRRMEREEEKPVILIEAGQEAGTDSVGLALYIIEQLLACEEYTEMLEKARWVILPNTNPDGMEYAKYLHVSWKKNVKPSEDKVSFGVDISRNFDNQWGSCDRVESGFSPIYPGPGPGSENETMFIKNIMSKYKKETKAYLSIRRDGHSILTPFAYTKNGPNSANIGKVAADIASKVNQRAGGVQLFVNDTIYNMNGKERCGHSVDYAHDAGIMYSYEMRVFLGSDNRVITRFQTLPRGYDTSLRIGYFNGIKELYSSIVNGKYGRLLF